MPSPGSTHTFWKGGITEWQMIYMLTQAGTCARTSLKARAHKRSIDAACQAVGLPGSHGSVAHLPKNPPGKSKTAAKAKGSTPLDAHYSYKHGKALCYRCSVGPVALPPLAEEPSEVFFLPKLSSTPALLCEAASQQELPSLSGRLVKPQRRAGCSWSPPRRSCWS